jgi:hypothetical protein
MRAALCRFCTFLIAAVVIAAVPLLARQDRTVTAADYARAEKFLAQNVANLVVGGTVTANGSPTIVCGTGINLPMAPSSSW